METEPFAVISLTLNKEDTTMENHLLFTINENIFTLLQKQLKFTPHRFNS